MENNETMYHLHILRKNQKTFTSISQMPIKELYAMLHAAIDITAKQSDQSFYDVLAILADLNKFAEETNQK